MPSDKGSTSSRRTGSTSKRTGTLTATCLPSMRTAPSYLPGFSVFGTSTRNHRQRVRLRVRYHLVGRQQAHLRGVVAIEA